MSDKYTILWRPVSRSSADEVDIARRFGEEESGETGDAPRLSQSQLEAKDAAEIAAAPDVIAIAPEMSTKLIEPYEAASDSTDTGELWGLAAVGAINSSYSGKGVRVAVLDTGIERNHPAFVGVNITERDFSGSGNGDRRGHGTHCAGTIFGREVGGLRIGVAPGIETVFIGKVLGDNGRGTSSMIFDGLKWAIDQRADVISMSLGLDFPGQVQERVTKGWPVDLATSSALEDFRKNMMMFDAIMRLARAGRAFENDPLVVAAAGNQSRRSLDPSYKISASLPAATSDVSVGAVGITGDKLTIAHFSNSNPDLTAPGMNIKSAWIGGGLHTISGTSMACPHVAGVAALWAESIRNGGKSPGSVVRSHLIARARKDMFAAGVDLVDIGQGLVMAP